MNLTFEKFEDVIYHLYLLRKQEDKINEILNDSYYREIQNDFVSGYSISNPIIEQDLINTLETMFDDTSHWISYFVYEIDFGVKWHEGMIIDTEGNNIFLRNVNDLWRILNDNL